MADLFVCRTPEELNYFRTMNPCERSFSIAKLARHVNCLRAIFL